MRASANSSLFPWEEERDWHCLEGQREGTLLEAASFSSLAFKFSLLYWNALSWVLRVQPGAGRRTTGVPAAPEIRPCCVALPRGR